LLIDRSDIFHDPHPPKCLQSFTWNPKGICMFSLKSLLNILAAPLLLVLSTEPVNPLVVRENPA
jgi:hypothetical protein